MERDSEEENKHEKRKQIVTHPDWLDLPEAIVTNIILEHLPLVDYIRFSAVCKRWYSIQKEHRIRYSPCPPPSPLPFPWLRCRRCSLDHEKDTTLVFHLANKRKTYKIPLFKTFTRGYKLECWNGWLLLLLGQSLCIVNPITGVQIELPPFLIPMPDRISVCYSSLISSPPTDPDCTIMIIGYDDKAYLYRLHDNNGWKTIERSWSYNRGRTIFCRSKIYRMEHCGRVCMVDTLLSDLTEQMIKMDCSEICEALQFQGFDLVDFCGELIMVIIVYEAEADSCTVIKEFHLYRGDFSTHKWVRMESLGEYALFFSPDSTFSLPAVDVGCKKNTIYSSCFMRSRAAWSAFDLSTKDWVDGKSRSPPCEHFWNGSYSWFLPTLDYFGVDKWDGVGPIQLK